MIWLSNSTLSRLRDQLKSRGERPSLVLPGRPGHPGHPALAGAAHELTPDVLELVTMTTEYGPLCEAMYLMMSADGTVSNDEREVLKGALRNLSGDTLRSTHIEAMLDQASKNIVESGRTKRMEDVLTLLREDPARAEVAFILSAAIAFADNAIADEENETLNAFAEGLGIDDARANELLDSVESDLSRNGVEA